MIPKIEITYSKTYDAILHSYHDKNFSSSQPKKGILYSKKIQKIWDKNSSRILKAMASESGLVWKTRSVKIYPVKYCLSEFASPLTIYFYKDPEHAISIIIHELAHLLVWENEKKINEKRMRKYSHEDSFTRDHLLVHAICIQTLQKVFGKNAEKYLKYERFWEWDNWEFSRFYRRSWEIVQKKGAKNLLQELVKK
jgi:hypothetical protein